MLKYLRIAVAALSLTACVLLIVLWVRGYSRYDLFYFRIFGSPQFGMVSTYGCFSFGYERKAPHGSQPNTLIGTESGHYKSDPWVEQQIQAAVSASGFNVASFPGGGRLDVPSYFAVLIALIVTAFAARPWIRRRFGLRTLLIATTLVAVVLGIIVGATQSRIAD